MKRKSNNNGTNGVRTPFSAMVYIDGRIKPDVMAPGQNIISSYSSFYISNTHKEDGSVKNDLKSDIRRFKYNGRTYRGMLMLEHQCLRPL